MPCDAEWIAALNGKIVEETGELGANARPCVAAIEASWP
jgi:hypothetical protein